MPIGADVIGLGARDLTERLDDIAHADLIDQRFEREHGLAVLFKDYHLSLYFSDFGAWAAITC